MYLSQTSPMADSRSLALLPVGVGGSVIDPAPSPLAGRVMVWSCPLLESASRALPATHIRKQMD